MQGNYANMHIKLQRLHSFSAAFPRCRGLFTVQYSRENRVIVTGIESDKADITAARPLGDALIAAPLDWSPVLTCVCVCVSLGLLLPVAAHRL